MLEVECVKRMHEILPLLKNGEYEELNEKRPNYQDKVNVGMKYFVKYEVPFDGIILVVKCYAKEYDNGIEEHPYFLMAKKEEE